MNESLLDLQPMQEGIGKLLGAGPDAARLWFTTLLQYSLVGTVAGKCLDFAGVGAACLRMVAQQHGNELSEREAKKRSPPHAEVISALERLWDAEYRPFTLTNSSKAAAGTSRGRLGRG